MVKIVDNISTLSEIIEELHGVYLDFTTNFYRHVDSRFNYNLKKLKIDDAFDSQEFMLMLVKQYVDSLGNDENIGGKLLAVGMDYNFRYRIKQMDSLYRKMEHNLKKDRYVSKILNDFMGTRIILSNVNSQETEINELLGTLQQQGIISRFYHRDDKKYRALHCYFQDTNRHFPWEFQIWDLEDSENNYKEHERHEKEKSE